jgi:hypothetical protein
MQRPVHLARRHWLAARAGVLALIVSACGSGAAGQSPLSAGPELCQVTTYVERLVVQRPGIFPPGYFSFPANVSVTNPAIARQLAVDVCALPVVPSGESFRCPIDFGVIYNLRFRSINGGLISLDADPSGCQGVWGKGLATRRAVFSPDFWRELGTAMGLPRPSREVFIGKHAEATAPQ